MTTETLKLATFFISNMKERKCELITMSHVYTWVVGITDYITKVLNKGDLIPAEFYTFKDAVVSYTTDMVYLISNIDSYSECIPEEMLLSLYKNRVNISTSTKDLRTTHNASTELSYLLVPDSNDDRNCRILRDLTDFNGLTSHIMGGN